MGDFFKFMWPFQNVRTLTSKKVRGIFLIIEIRVIFAVNKILKIEMETWRHPNFLLRLTDPYIYQDFNRLFLLGLAQPKKMLYISSSVMVTATMSMVISHIFFSMFFYIGFFLFVFFMPVIFAIAVTSMPSMSFVIIIISGSWRSWWRIMPSKEEKKWSLLFYKQFKFYFYPIKKSHLWFRISKLKSVSLKRQYCNCCFFGRNSCFQCA